MVHRVQDQLTAMLWEVLKYLAYSPDLAACDMTFWNIKKHWTMGVAKSQGILCRWGT